MEMEQLPDRWSAHSDDAVPTPELADWLTAQAKLLATPLSAPARLQFAQLNAERDGQLATILEQTWSAALAVVNGQGEARSIVVDTAAKSLRFARNAVADCKPNQEAFYAHAESVVKLLHRTTSLASINDPFITPLTLAAVQFLSNTLTLNDHLQARFWDSYVLAQAPYDLLPRLLASPSSGVLSAAQILILNCVRFSPERSHSLASTAQGAVILAPLLQLADSAIADDEDEPSESMLEERLGVLYPLFTHLFSQRLFHAMYDAQAAQPSDLTGEPTGEPDLLAARIPLVSPTQLILLKLFDAYVHHGAVGYGSSVRTRPPLQSDDNTLLGLAALFLHLAGLAQQAIADVLAAERGDNAAPDEVRTPGVAHENTAPDTRLAAVHQSLVLVMQCLGTVGRAAMEGEGDSAQFTDADKDGVDAEAVNGPTYRAEGRLTLRYMRTEPFLDGLLSLLRTLTDFAPPISPFPSTARAAGPLPTGHAYSSTGRASAAAPVPPKPRRGLANLKRDLVRLLGVLSYASSGSGSLGVNGASGSSVNSTERSSDASPSHPNEHRTQVTFVQDIVRERGALWDVLGLTNLDEDNPYIREHAIFALRNLLDRNKASQDLVASLRRIDGPDSR